MINTHAAGLLHTIMYINRQEKSKSDFLSAEKSSKISNRRKVSNGFELINIVYGSQFICQSQFKLKFIFTLNGQCFSCLMWLMMESVCTMRNDIIYAGCVYVCVYHTRYIYFHAYNKIPFGVCVVWFNKIHCVFCVRIMRLSLRTNFHGNRRIL